MAVYTLDFACNKNLPDCADCKKTIEGCGLRHIRGTSYALPLNPSVDEVAALSGTFNIIYFGQIPTIPWACLWAISKNVAQSVTRLEPLLSLPLEFHRGERGMPIPGETLCTAALVFLVQHIKDMDCKIMAIGNGKVLDPFVQTIANSQ